jgi:hypothetical protein
MTDLADIAAAYDATEQPNALFRAIDAALARAPGFKLFTVLVCRPEKKLTQRVYTSNPQAYPVGGTKPMTPSPWSDGLFIRGEPYIGYTREDIRTVFFDYELIWSLGCESVINMPVRWRSQTLGTLNLLHQANYYEPRHVAPVRLLAQMCLPGIFATELGKAP